MASKEMPENMPKDLRNLSQGLWFTTMSERDRKMIVRCLRFYQKAQPERNRKWKQANRVLKRFGPSDC